MGFNFIVSGEAKVPTVNPDSQPVISSRPGGFARAPGVPGSQLEATRFSVVPGALTRKLSLPVPVSGAVSFFSKKVTFLDSN